MVKVRGLGELSPLLQFDPPAPVQRPPMESELILLNFGPMVLSFCVKGHRHMLTILFVFTFSHFGNSFHTNAMQTLVCPILKVFCYTKIGQIRLRPGLCLPPEPGLSAVEGQTLSLLPTPPLNQDFKVTIVWRANNSKMVQDKARVTMADQYKVVYDLSIGAIFNDFERPLTQISRSCQYSIDASASLRYKIDRYLGLQGMMTSKNLHTPYLLDHRCNFEWHWTTLTLWLAKFLVRKQAMIELLPTPIY